MRRKYRNTVKIFTIAIISGLSSSCNMGNAIKSSGGAMGGLKGSVIMSVGENIRKSEAKAARERRNAKYKQQEEERSKRQTKLSQVENQRLDSLLVTLKQQINTNSLNKNTLTKINKSSMNLLSIRNNKQNEQLISMASAINKNLNYQKPDMKMAFIGASVMHNIVGMINGRIKDVSREEIKRTDISEARALKSAGMVAGVGGTVGLTTVLTEKQSDIYSYAKYFITQSKVLQRR